MGGFVKLTTVMEALMVAGALSACVGNGWQASDPSGADAREGRRAGEGPGRDNPAQAVVQPPMRQVPLVVVHSEVSLQLLAKGRKIPFQRPKDCLLQSRRLEKKGELTRSDWVFVGYGLTVPALGWDHYQHRDVRGKTVVMLAGAPPIPDGAAVSSAAALNHPLERSLGHWRGKFENARRHGAVAALIVQAVPEGVPLGEGPENFDVVIANVPGESPDTLAVYGWVREKNLSAGLKRAGLRWDSLRKRAAAADFSPVALPVQGNIQWANRWQELEIAIPQ